MTPKEFEELTTGDVVQDKTSGIFGDVVSKTDNGFVVKWRITIGINQFIHIRDLDKVDLIKKHH